MQTVQSNLMTHALALGWVLATINTLTDSPPLTGILVFNNNLLQRQQLSEVQKSTSPYIYSQKLDKDTSAAFPAPSHAYGRISLVCTQLYMKIQLVTFLDIRSSFFRSLFKIYIFKPIRHFQILQKQISPVQWIGNIEYQEASPSSRVQNI